MGGSKECVRCSRLSKVCKPFILLDYRSPTCFPPVSFFQVYHSELRLVLASASPRRAELLTRAGYAFDIVPANIDERVLDGESPERYVVRLAGAKVDAVAVTYQGRVLLGADTIVTIDKTLLGKPRDPAEAVEMLHRLAGRTHEVLTGVALRLDCAHVSAVERTRVTLTQLSDVQIDWYVRTGEPLDKAGAYGVQDIASRFATRVEGSYTNVVGFPVSLIDRLLLELAEG